MRAAALLFLAAVSASAQPTRFAPEQFTIDAPRASGPTRLTEDQFRGRSEARAHLRTSLTLVAPSQLRERPGCAWIVVRAEIEGGRVILYHDMGVRYWPRERALGRPRSWVFASCPYCGVEACAA